MVHGRNIDLLQGNAASDRAGSKRPMAEKKALRPSGL